MQGLNREEAIALPANLTAGANNLLIDLNYQGRTIVIMLHDLNQACRYADYLVAICRRHSFKYNGGCAASI